MIARCRRRLLRRVGLVVFLAGLVGAVAVNSDFTDAGHLVAALIGLAISLLFWRVPAHPDAGVLGGRKEDEPTRDVHGLAADRDAASDVAGLAAGERAERGCG